MLFIGLHGSRKNERNKYNIVKKAANNHTKIYVSAFVCSFPIPFTWLKYHAIL
jgi:hypothetical protein